MTRVIAYTYLADTHVPDDAKLDWRDGRLVVNHRHPHALPVMAPPNDVDEHGLPYNLQDAEGNLIDPVFDADEGFV